MNNELEILASMLAKTTKEYLPKEPISTDLLKYVKGLRTKRLRKKFLICPSNYSPRFIPREVLLEYSSKRIAKIGAEFIKMSMSKESFFRRIFSVEEALKEERYL